MLSNNANDLETVTLIIEGDKTFDQVPAKAKPEVKRQLELLGYPDLAQ